MTVLVTGATGFIGPILVEKLLAAGHKVRATGLVRHRLEELAASRLGNLDVELVTGDLVELTQASENPSLMNGVDTVFHLAAAQHEMGIPDSRFVAVNVEASRRLFELSANAGVKRFVYGSSIGVYGEGSGCVDEMTPPAPENIYQRTKFEAEKVLTSASQATDRPIDLVIVRISETYGPGDGRLLKLFSMIDKGMPFSFGQGLNLHHPIYVGDLVEGLLLACETPAAGGETLLLAGPEPLSTKDMITDVAVVLDRKPPSINLPLWPFLSAAWLCETLLRPLGINPPLHRRRMDFFVKEFSINCSKAAELLGFRAKTGFREGAGVTAEWYKQHGMLKSGLKNEAGETSSLASQ